MQEDQNSTSPLHVVSEKKWYKDGLRFQCTGCGKCCTGFPGAVWVTEEEIECIAEYLNETIVDTLQKYTRVISDDGRRSLQEVGKKYDCVFLKDKKRCSVYEVRPKQCRTYPWWPSVIESETSWNEEKNICEGIDHPDAPVITEAEIRQNMK